MVHNRLEGMNKQARTMPKKTTAKVASVIDVLTGINTQI